MCACQNGCHAVHADPQQHDEITEEATPTQLPLHLDRYNGFYTRALVRYWLWTRGMKDRIGNDTRMEVQPPSDSYCYKQDVQRMWFKQFVRLVFRKRQEKEVCESLESLGLFLTRGCSVTCLTPYDSELPLLSQIVAENHFRQELWERICPSKSAVAPTSAGDISAPALAPKLP